ncbi:MULTISPECIES: GNAT family N-acetyltransferase [unclassified Ruminococcus]|uniref:GNAT family N-acetyltransferase n=1 Tax=unclassified Ruminococcus TaxID=2608920 RepID=UPI00210D92BD|nr:MULTISPECIES: GNAT family N-acetyltransferase [unclassified Ruminococcus]MCQ4023194.1 GNAT family N-acetyltransferase [Ruminococcus sp. zg-924]MCQ4115412.1 GNAT family N-acetyltransferase [Ruminococcus sp. zg-921]
MAECFRPDYADVQSLKSLYSACFNESTSATDIMFKAVLNIKYAYAARFNGEIIAALYLLPCEIALDSATAQAHYLMGASTKKEYRGLGVMTQLIRFAVAQSEKQGDCYSVLEPASEELYSFYSRLGYREAYHSTVFDYDIQQNRKKHFNTCRLTKNSFDIWSGLRFNICKSIRGSVLWDESHLKACAEVNACYGGGVLGCEYGYAYYSSDAYGVFVNELVCKQELAESLLCSLGDELGVSRLSVRCPSGILNGRSVKMGMVLPLNDNKFPLDFEYNAYLGLSFD